MLRKRFCTIVKMQNFFMFPAAKSLLAQKGACARIIIMISQVYDIRSLVHLQDEIKVVCTPAGKAPLVKARANRL